MNESTFLTNAQFLNIFKERDDKLKQNSDGSPFCWILGSGASVQSGIPMGRKLAKRWLSELYQPPGAHGVTPGTSIEEWSKTRFQHVSGFDYDRAANYLPFIYHERYRTQPQDGYREIEGILDDAKLSFGYSVLAHLMTNGPHRIGITTYFDNLLFNAIATYTSEIPLLCGYESVMRYVNPSIWKKPLIVKLQRDLMLAPKIDVNEITMLPKEWELPLIHIFEHYTPIVIGYGDDGGSGGNLMSFLENLSTLKNGIFWCYRETATHGKPAKEVQDIVKRLGGHLVPILGFDEFMVQLWDTLLLTSIGDDMKERSDNLTRVYRDQFLQLARSLSKQTDIRTTALTTQNSAKSALNRWLQDEFL